jgi:hypothetical protein
MENVGHVAVIVRMQRRQSALPVRYFNVVATTLSQFKSHMEFGAVYLKMIAQQS